MELSEIYKNLEEVEKIIDYSFKDKTLLLLAFTHRSFVNENRDLVRDHNERLEFLGDAVLGLLISEYLYKYLPETPEGELSYLRSRLVEATSCVTYIQKLDLEKFLLLGKGEKMNDGRGRESILSDLFEALIGAVFVDGGIDGARRFIFHNFSIDINEIMKKPVHNWKALLQDYAQKHHQVTPVYEVMDESGPDHSKTFEIRVLIQDDEVGRGKGNSKKEAQQNAAEVGAHKLGIV